jgi:hypothetical protein
VRTQEPRDNALPCSEVCQGQTGSCYQTVSTVCGRLRTSWRSAIWGGQRCNWLWHGKIMGKNWNNSGLALRAVTVRVCACLCTASTLRSTWILIQLCSNKENSSRRYLKEVKQPHYRPGQAFRLPAGWGSQISRQSAHESGKVVSPTHGPHLPPGDIPGTHFFYTLSRPQCHSASERIMSMKNFNDTIGNRTRDLPASSAVPQWNASQSE